MKEEVFTKYLKKIRMGELEFDSKLLKLLNSSDYEGIRLELYKRKGKILDSIELADEVLSNSTANKTLKIIVKPLNDKSYVKLYWNTESEMELIDEKRTSLCGITTFENIPCGDYAITVRNEDYEPSTTSFTIHSHGIMYNQTIDTKSENITPFFNEDSNECGFKMQLKKYKGGDK